MGQFWPAFDKLVTDDDGRGMLSIAAIDGNLDLVMMLAYFKGVDINSRDNNRRIPLHPACIVYCIGVAKLFLDVPGLNVAVRSNHGELAYDLARINKDHTIGLIFVVNVFGMSRHDLDDALVHHVDETLPSERTRTICRNKR